VNDEIVRHYLRCGTCWQWRYELWRWDRLCATGADLLDRYTVAQARSSSSGPQNPRPDSVGRR